MLLGGRRHLELLPDIPGQRRIPLPADLRAELPELVADHAAAGVVVLASGDPLLAGIGSTLVDLLGRESVRIHPAISSVALARARMGWAAETVEVIRLRGDDLDQIRRALFPGRRLLILSRDAGSPDQVAQLLTDAGFGASALTVLSDLGAADRGAAERAGRHLVRLDGTPHHRLRRVPPTCRRLVVAGSWPARRGLRP